MFNNGWKFKKLSDGSQLNGTAINFSDWEEVNLPHTWNQIDGSDRSGDSYYRGLGGYVREYTFSQSEYSGKRIFLEFEGANTVTTLYMNKIQVGQPHRGGYAKFRYDITEAVKLDESNLIAVLVDNSRTTYIAPLDKEGDFTKFGGIYREVSIIAADPVHFDLMDDGSDGIYITNPEITKDNAVTEIRARVANDSAEVQAVTVRAVLLDADGVFVAGEEQETGVNAGETACIPLTMLVPEPHLWNGIKDPYVYTLYVNVLSGSYKDSKAISIGYRYFSIHQGEFLLNGEKYEVHGVNYHQDSFENGFAMTEEQRDRDYTIMRDMGVTAVRMAHYQHAPYEYELCDRAGFIVWTEIPLINHAMLENEAAPSKAFCDNIKQQLQELIKQNYNHPGVLFWGISNELYDINEETKALFTELCDLAKEEDPFRITIYADNVASTEIRSRSEAAEAVGYNCYDGWYYNSLGEMHRRVNGLMEADPRPTCISEYGAGGAITQHMDNPTMEDISPNGAPHYEEYQAIYHEVLCSEINSMKIWGSFLWCMFDFASDTREEGDTKGINDKGMVTRDRSVCKDVYYFYRSVWNEENMVYITGRRFNPRKKDIPEVKIYSNAASVELFVNGTSYGKIERTNLKENQNTIYKWKNISLISGRDNEINAVALYADGTSGEDRITVAGE